MRLYRALLHLYPSSFRAEYGEEMAAVFRNRLRDAGGASGRVGLWFRAIADIAANALAVHWDTLEHDLRYTARSLAHARGFALTAIVIVALGVGANTAAFSVTDFVLFRPLPVKDAHRLVTVWQTAPGYARMELSPANYRDWRQAATSFEQAGLHTQSATTLIRDGEPERLLGASVSADLFPTLGVRAALGRIFAEGDDAEGATPTIVLSHGLWRTAFGGDPAVLGSKLTLEDGPYTVIGVMPPDFAFPGRDVEFWVPLVFTPDDYQDRGNNSVPTGLPD